MFIMNQMIASQLREIPHMKPSDMTKGKSRLVKTLTEITACYVQLAQVDMENNFTERVYNRVDLMNLKRKNNLCI